MKLTMLAQSGAPGCTISWSNISQQHALVATATDFVALSYFTRYVASIYALFLEGVESGRPVSAQF